jgi:hypothetical protein
MILTQLASAQLLFLGLMEIWRAPFLRAVTYVTQAVIIAA